jgi:hypothetical protein
MRFLMAGVLCLSFCRGAAPQIAGCPVFTSKNIWNTPVDKLPVSSTSEVRIATIGAAKPLHPDFGADPNAGIPFDVVSSETQVKRTSFKFQYAEESDKVIYPVPLKPSIENGADSVGDRHVLIVDKSACILYEIFNYHPPAGADAGAVFDLRSDQLRPEPRTSTDAAGLPVFPGLVRYEEVASGEIRHALRFTVPQTQSTYVWPARHIASKLAGQQYMPMGTRLRLKASVDISGFSPANKVILIALKKYGMMLADNGGAWFLSGAPDPRWKDDDLAKLKTLTGADFEEVPADSMIWASDTAEIQPPSK